MSEPTVGEGTGPVTEVELVVRDPSYPFVGVSADELCTFELAKLIPRSGSQCSEFFTVTRADPARITRLGKRYEDVDVSLLAEYERGGLFEFLVSNDCPALTLAELGALPREVHGVDGEGSIVAEIPPRSDPATVVDEFLDDNPDAEVASKREKERVEPLFTRSAFQQVLETHLTGRQREVVRTAFESGYYEWPRDCTGEDVAAELGITSATFSEHIHAAERNLLTALFGESGPSADRERG